MSIVFTEVRIEDRGGVELSFMEGGCLDELDISPSAICGTQ